MLSIVDKYGTIVAICVRNHASIFVSIELNHLQETCNLFEGANNLSRTIVEAYNAWQWRHNGRDGVSTHQPHDGVLNRLFRLR